MTLTLSPKSAITSKFKLPIVQRRVKLPGFNSFSGSWHVKTLYGTSSSSWATCTSSLEMKDTLWSLLVSGTDISQKDEKPSKKQQNQSRDGKVCEGEAQSKSSQLREEKAKKNFAKPSILGKPVGQPLKNQSVARQPTAFKSKRPRISKPQFASQVDVNNDLSKPVTTHHLPKGRKSAPGKTSSHDCPTHLADQASVFMAMTFEQRSSSLILHQMTSDHNRSELGIHDHSNEPSSSKLVPKVVPLAVKTATSRQEFGNYYFPPSYSMLRITGNKYKIRKIENFQKESSRHVSWNR
ncbi:hypothetical protein Tco_1216419 [Tanacetum coccineum]